MQILNFILKRIRKNKKDNKEECKKSVDEKKYKTDFAKRIDQLMFLIIKKNIMVANCNNKLNTFS